jgi:hypothetical protein
VEVDLTLACISCLGISMQNECHKTFLPTFKVVILYFQCIHFHFDITVLNL